MPKNKGKGGKNRRRGKNDNDDDKRELIFKEDGQGTYAPFFSVMCFWQRPPARSCEEDSDISRNDGLSANGFVPGALC